MPRLQDPQRTLGLLFGGNVLFAAGLFFHAFLYNFYLDAIGHSEAVMGYAAASLTAGGLAALLPAGKLVDKLGCTQPRWWQAPGRRRGAWPRGQ